MAEPDLFEELAQDAADLEGAPSDEGISRVRQLGAEFFDTDQEVSRLEAELESAKQRRNELAHRRLPDLMNELGIDHLGLPGADVDLNLAPYAKASIPVDWPEERRASAFSHLEELGVQDIIKTTVTFSLGRDKLEEARRLARYVTLAAEKQGIEIDPPDIGLSVHWATLTSTIKELIEREGAALDLERLNATVGQVVKIKKRN